MEKELPKSCCDCNESEITLVNGYLRCKLTGNCYIPIVMREKRSEVCPLENRELNESILSSQKIHVL